jgi:hypothetical protein
MHKILIYFYIIHLLKSSTCFEHYPAHLQEVKMGCTLFVPFQHSGKIMYYLLWRWCKCTYLKHKGWIYMSRWCGMSVTFCSEQTWRTFFCVKQSTSTYIASCIWELHNFCWSDGGYYSPTYKNLIYYKPVTQCLSFFTCGHRWCFMHSCV